MKAIRIGDKYQVYGDSLQAYGMLATAQLRRMAPQNHGGELFAQG